MTKKILHLTREDFERLLTEQLPEGSMVQVDGLLISVRETSVRLAARDIVVDVPRPKG